MKTKKPIHHYYCVTISSIIIITNIIITIASLLRVIQVMRQCSSAIEICECSGR